MIITVHGTYQDRVIECVVKDCSIDFLLDTPVLILHGTLCDSQRFELKGMKDTQILLKDALFYYLPNFRWENNYCASNQNSNGVSLLNIGDKLCTASLHIHVK